MAQIEEIKQQLFLRLKDKKHFKGIAIALIGKEEGIMIYLDDKRNAVDFDIPKRLSGFRIKFESLEQVKLR